MNKALKIETLFWGRQSKDYDESGFPIGDNNDYSLCGYPKPHKIIEYYECYDCNTLFVITSSSGRDGDGDFDDSQGLHFDCQKCSKKLKRNAIKYEDEKIKFEIPPNSSTLYDSVKNDDQEIYDNLEELVNTIEIF